VQEGSTCHVSFYQGTIGATAYHPESSRPKPRESADDIVAMIESALDHYKAAKSRIDAMDSGSVIPLDEVEVRNNLERLGITAAQRHVLSLVFEGWPNELIAKELGVTGATVRAHLSHARKKLGLTRGECLAPAVLGMSARDLMMRSLID